MWVGKSDYVKNLSAKIRLEMGVKGTLSRVQNDVVLETFRQEQWQRDEELTQNVFMDENIGAGYLSFHSQMNPKTRLQMGLRYEYSHTELKNQEQEKLLERRNGYLFPSLSFSRDITKQHSLQFSYSQRIMRPTYNDLAPYIVFVDRYTFYSGNMSLKPTLSSILRMGYRFKEKYLLALQYSYDKNAIAAWQVRVDPLTRKQYTYPENIDGVNTLSLSVSFPLQIGSFWQMQHTFTGNRQDLSTHFEGNNLNSNRINGQANWIHTFKLPYQLTFELSGFYQTPSLLGMALRKAYGVLNLGLQKQLPKGKGILRLSLEDLFWTLPLLELEYHQPNKGFTKHVHYRNEPRILRLTYSANFGNKNVKANKRSTASEEERKRVSN
jgi:outer membrane receptor protein involved in Fe transport